MPAGRKPRVTTRRSAGVPLTLRQFPARMEAFCPDRACSHSPERPPTAQHRSFAGASLLEPSHAPGQTANEPKMHGDLAANSVGKRVVSRYIASHSASTIVATFYRQRMMI